MLQRLVVGVDGSDASGAAAAFAIWLAGTAGADVTLLHACPDLRLAEHAPHTADPAALGAAAELRLAETAEWQRRLRNLADYAGAGARVGSRVVRGRPAAALLDAAAELDSDAILIGSTGVGALRGRLLGSVSSQVVDHARGSVMVFPEGQASSPAHVASVVVGIDGSVGSAAAIAAGRSLALALDAKLVLVCAYASTTALATPTAEPGAELRRHAAGVVASARETVGTDVEVIEDAREGEARQALVDACEQYQPAVLVVRTRGLGGFRGLLVGSTSRWVLNHAPCPVLVARARSEIQAGCVMTNHEANPSPTVLVGFDGSPDAAVAIEVGALLFADAAASIAHVWAPPFTAHPSHELLRRAGSVDGLMALLDEQGRARAESVTREGVRLARAAGWQAEPVSRRSFAAEGLELARLAEELHPVALIVGARGVSGVRAVLGSVSDAVVHYSPVPVLVVPPMNAEDPLQATHDGPVLVACDGSSGANTALVVARRLWPLRRFVVASVGCRAADGVASDEMVEAVVLEAHGVPETARSVADALAEHAAAIGAAAIVVGSRGQSVHREIFLGSVAMATLHHGHRPVLAVPPPNRLAQPPAPAASAGASPS